MDNIPQQARRRTDYLSYLLRLWQDGQERAVWRASLQSPEVDERVGFVSLDDLFGFLRRQIDQLSGANGDQKDGWERR